jgi:pimeloyl-ACP methyl ester carboxylesterase
MPHPSRLRSTLVLLALLLCFACDDGESGSASDAALIADAGTHVDSGASVDAGQLTPVDRSNLADVGVTAELDYSDSRLWLCGPESVPNECTRNLDATEIEVDGSRATVTHALVENPPFDCFYVYPTVQAGAGALMTNFADLDKLTDPLLSQASWFASLCRVHAPLYRQIGISLTGGPNPLDPAAITRGVADIRNAFHYFLDHYSKGRKFVLIGHSQGTATLAEVIRSEVDNDPALRARLISAVLVGGNVTTAQGQRTGGTFQNIPTCSTPGETGCVIAYSSFAKEAPPTSASLFGRAATGLEVVCTEPAALAGNGGRYKGSYARTSVANASFKADGELPAGITTPFALYRDYFRGQCQTLDGARYLEISIDPAAGDTRTPLPYRNSLLELGGFGLHIVDFSLVMDDLLEAERQQGAAELK